MAWLSGYTTRRKITIDNTKLTQAVKEKYSIESNAFLLAKTKNAPMKKLKIAVSTIAKNEVNNVKYFVASCKDADIVSILDTGSDDGTIELLKELGVYAGKKIIEPFDFSRARNEALKALPDDIDVVVSIDMDERLKPGWREELEKIWQPETEAVNYTYISKWQDEAKTIPAIVCLRSKIFKRKGFKWFNNVHEVPFPEDRRNPVITSGENIVVYHYQTGSRNYIKMLDESIKKDPENQDAYIQRGADYMTEGNYSKGIENYNKFIELARKQQKKYQTQSSIGYKLLCGQIAQSFIEIARAKMLMKFSAEEIIKNLLLAVAEAPDMREPWVYLADGWMSIGNYGSAYACAMNALQVNNSGIYPKEMICWGEFPKQIADTAYSKIAKGIIFEIPNH